MASAQLSPGADSTVLKASNNSGNFDRKNLNFSSEFGDSANQRLDMFNEQAKSLKGIDEVAVDVTESRRNIDARVAAEDDPDATECSSSFADTTSGDEECSGLSDAEVESQFYGSYDELGSLFPMRKKKLTSHWRNYIRPLMWRCKWTELKIKEFGLLASKYRRKVDAYDQKKLMGFDQSRVEQFGSRSLPYTSHSKRKIPLKRRKRKKVEQDIDISAYMANHNLFSYRENKKHDHDGASTGDDLVNPAMCTRPNHTGSYEFGLNDDWSIHEESLNFEEEILRKIDLTFSRVHKLKAKVDSVITKYAGKFSSCESLSHLVPCDAQTSSVRSPTFSACNGDTVSVGGLYASFPQMSVCELEDFALADGVVSNYGDDIFIPDIIESTVGLLSSTDVTEHQSQVGDLCEKIVDNILIHNEVVNMEMQTEKQIQNQDADDVSEDEITNPSLPLEEDQQVVKTTLSHEKSTLKRCLASDISFPKSKRKRGERKAGSGSWSRQLPGEHDSQ